MTNELEDEMIAHNKELRDDKDFDEAMEVANELEKIHPNETVSLFVKGITLYENGELDEALKFFTEAVRQDNDKLIIWEVIGLTLIGLGRFDEAIESLEYVYSKKPQNVEVMVGLSICYEVQNEHDKGKSILTKADKINHEKTLKHLNTVHTKYIMNSKMVDSGTKSIIERNLETWKVKDLNY